MVDLNGLKAANDELGHAAGDRVAAAGRRGAQLDRGQAGQAARIGGDEFALLLPETDEAGGER